MSPATKTCTKCGDTKPLDGFPPRRNQCRVCLREYHRAYQREKHDELTAYWRSYSRRPEVQERVKARQAAKPKSTRKTYSPTEKTLARREAKRRYYAKNKERVKRESAERMRRLARENPAKYTEQQRARRYKLTGIDREYAAILAADPCSYCGGPMEHLDHIVPRRAGGPHDWDNLTASCGSCNAQKQQQPLLRFLWYRAHLDTT